MKRFLGPIAVAMLIALLAVSAASSIARNGREARQNRASITTLETIQQSTQATLALLRATVLEFTGPKAQAAQRAATEAFINRLIDRIDAENAALLSAIEGGSNVIVRPGPTVTRTRTVCRTPSGKAC